MWSPSILVIIALICNIMFVACSPVAAPGLGFLQPLLQNFGVTQIGAGNAAAVIGAQG